MPCLDHSDAKKQLFCPQRTQSTGTQTGTNTTQKEHMIHIFVKMYLCKQLLRAFSTLFVHIYIYIYIYIHILSLSMYQNIHESLEVARAFSTLFVHTYIYVYIHICMYVCVCVCVCIYIYIYIYIYSEAIHVSEHT